MSKKKKNSGKKSYEDLYLELRKDWGDFNPQTKVIKPKTNYRRKPKYKEDYLDNYEEKN